MAAKKCRAATVVLQAFVWSWPQDGVTTAFSSAVDVFAAAVAAAAAAAVSACARERHKNGEALLVRVWVKVAAARVDIDGGLTW